VSGSASKRAEFSAKTQEQALKRSNRVCENKKCCAPLSRGKYHFDHVLPDGLGGKPTLANCQVLCIQCHKEKTAKEDVPRIRKADRQKRADDGIKRPSPPIASRPKQEKIAPRFTKTSLPPRALYEKIQ
jgi:5-methylcytosine-specific restriction protein A